MVKNPTLGIALAAAAALATAQALAALDLPNLTGTWQLNKDQSDDPAKVIRDARSENGGGGGGGRGGFSGGGMGMGRHHGGGGGSRGGGSDSSSSGGFNERFAALETLQIDHKDPSLEITDAAGRERTLYTDGRKTEEEHSYGGTTAVTASWKDGHLEVVSKPESGAKITETYAVAADHSQMTVTTKVDGGRSGSYTIRRVYDAVKPGAPKPGTPNKAPSPRPAASDDDEDQSV